MYYSKTNLYLNEKNMILFNLNNFKIYNLDEDTYKLLKKIHLSNTYTSNEEKKLFDMFFNFSEYF